MNLNQASAVVTGGASGLGLATVERARRRGVAVTIVDLPQSPGEDVARELGDLATFSPSRRSRRRGRRRGARPGRRRGRRCGRWCTAPVAAARCGSSTGTARPATTTSTARSSTSTWSARSTCCGSRRRGWPPTSRSTASAASACSPRRSPRGRARSARSPTPRPRPASSGMTLVAARDLSRALIRVCSIAPGVFDTPILSRFSDEIRARAGRPGAAPGAAGPAGGVRLDGDAHHRQPDAQRRDDPARRRDPDGAAVTEAPPVLTDVESTASWSSRSTAPRPATRSTP